VQSQTDADKCPNCGKKFKVQRKRRGGCLSILGAIVVIGILIAVIASVVGGGKSKPVTAADVTNRVAGTFIRSGCFGCENTDKIATSNAYCGWDGDDVIVHVAFANSSAEELEVSWHPTYTIENGTAHGTGISSIQKTKIPPGGSVEEFVKQSPKGTTAGTPIARCYPSFFLVKPA
jgi:hypothetical protein